MYNTTNGGFTDTGENYYYYY